MAGRKRSRKIIERDIPEPKQPPPRHKQKENESGFIGVTHAAMLLECRYQRARDRILSGEFGTPMYDGRWLTVSKQKVLSAKYRENNPLKV